MTEETQGTPEGARPEETSAENSWQTVGQQFQVLGESIAQAFRTAWETEENQRRLQEMRKGLESMVNDVGKAIDDTANSPKGQKIREEAGRTVDVLRSAGEQTVQEVRPQLINALQQVNMELQKLIERMEKPKSGAGPSDEGPGANI